MAVEWLDAARYADSDADIRGAFVLPLDTVLGLERDKETWEVTEVIEGLEVDWVAHDVRKFLTLMMKRNGYVLEQLYSPLVVHGGPWLDELRELILQQAPIARLKEAARTHGMASMRQEALEAVKQGQTTLQEINRVTFVE